MCRACAYVILLGLAELAVILLDSLIIARTFKVLAAVDVGLVFELEHLLTARNGAVKLAAYGIYL